MKKILEVKNLKVSLINETENLQIIRGFDIDLWPGEIVGILGESGSGKTIATSTIMRIFDANEAVIDEGEILFEGHDLAKQNEKQLRKIRGEKMSYVFQNPSQALHPYKKIGKQMLTRLKLHDFPCSKDIVLKALCEVGLSNAGIIYNEFPSQLSTGQNQRIMVAQSILCNPSLLIADEPTSSIDVSLRKKILDLFLSINKKYKTAIIIVTHDFDIVKYLCSRLVIMYGGLCIEQGTLNDVLKAPLHPYTEELIKCAVSLENSDETLYSLGGTPITPNEFDNTCPFYNRCRAHQDECCKEIPKLIKVGNQTVRCIESVVRKRKASFEKGEM